MRESTRSTFGEDYQGLAVMNQGPANSLAGVMATAYSQVVKHEIQEVHAGGGAIHQRGVL
jgi:hypothetical protein